MIIRTQNRLTYTLAPGIHTVVEYRMGLKQNTIHISFEPILNQV